jgi:hypothetical protein
MLFTNPLAEASAKFAMIAYTNRITALPGKLFQSVMNLGHVSLTIPVSAKPNIIASNSLLSMFRNICNKSMLVAKK